MIGNRLRETRKNKKMTLIELAEKTGFTASYISQIERELIEPSITALRKFCTALEVKLYYFLEEEASEPTIVRADRRQKLKLPESSVEYEFVSPMGIKKEDINPKIEAIEIIIEPQKWSSDDFFSHNADEIIFILEGQLVIAIDNSQEVLNEGDSIYLFPKTLHKFFNPADTYTKILSIITPPIY